MGRECIKFLTLQVDCREKKSQHWRNKAHYLTKILFSLLRSMIRCVQGSYVSKDFARRCGAIKQRIVDLNMLETMLYCLLFVLF